MYISEQEIESYITQFNVTREQAIKEISNILEEYYMDKEDAMQEVYEDIKRSSY